MGHLSVELSGGVRCALDGRLLPPPPRRDIVRLLVYLALQAPATVARSALAADLWPHLPPLRARSNLRLILHSLQRHLATVGGDVACLSVSPEGIGWDPTLRVTVDLRQTLDLAESQTQTTADALPVPEGALPDWSDPWFDGWRRRFDDARGRLLTQQGAAWEAAGQPAEARQAALRLLALRPADEAAHMRLVRLLAAAGDLAGARLQFERCCELLEDELGQRPSAASMSVARRLFGRRPIDHGAPAAAPEAGWRAVAMPFIDQGGRVARITDLSRDHRLLVVTGPAGGGKSRLLQGFHATLGSAPPWVDLDGCTRDAMVADRIDQALAEPVATGPEQLLLIDHAEAALRLGVGALLRDRLRANPALRLLVASRVPLLIGGERLWRVPPLLLQAAATAGRVGLPAEDPEGIGFLTAAMDRSDPVAQEQRSALGDLVAVLEGRPLALLAAAALLRPAADLAAQARGLAAQTDLLLDVPLVGARHATLAAAMAADALWLEPAALALLPALAGLPGAFGPAEAWACGTAADEDSILDLFGQLARGGLLAPLPSAPGALRFRLDPLARAYWSRPTA